jgi:hypothetical protein
MPGSVTSYRLGGQKVEKENNTKLALAIAMGTVVWAMIGYALLSPNPPAPAKELHWREHLQTIRRGVCRSAGACHTTAFGRLGLCRAAAAQASAPAITASNRTPTPR